MLKKDNIVKMRNSKKINNSQRLWRISLTWIAVFLFPAFLLAQRAPEDSIAGNVTIEGCVRYALENNPQLQNAKINQDITEAAIKSRLADWYPQINFNYILQHNFQLPTINQNGNLFHSGSQNTSGAAFGLTQNIFNRDVLLASRSATDVRLEAKQNASEQNIHIAALVSKAFYDVILTSQQIQVTIEDIQRIELSLKDAFYQYQSGVTDKTDYKRATISLNNAKALKKTGEESLKAKSAYLKELMGYPSSKNLQLKYDTAKMATEIFVDTLQSVTYSNRIEIQLLQTQRALQQYNLQYYKWGFLPDVSVFGNYNLNFQNNQFSKVYNQMYPVSNAGVTLSVPLFQGGKRIQQIRQAQLQIKLADNDILDFQHQVNTQYEKALATYKSNLYDYYSLKDNQALANEVYDVIRLQYRSGVKAFLEVINAESDLRTAQLNYYDALYLVLSSKIDVEQSLGNIQY